MVQDADGEIVNRDLSGRGACLWGRRLHLFLDFLHGCLNGLENYCTLLGVFCSFYTERMVLQYVVFIEVEVDKSPRTSGAQGVRPEVRPTFPGAFRYFATEPHSR